MLAHSTRSVLSPLQALAFTIALAVTLGAVLVIPLVPIRYQLHEGAVAPATIKSPTNVRSFHSPTLTRERQFQVANSLSDVLIFDPTVHEKQMAKAEEVFAWLQQVGTASRSGAQPSASGVNQPSEVTLSSQALANILTLSATQWQEVQDETLTLLRQTRQDRIAANQLPSAKAQLSQRINPKLTQEQTAIVVELVHALLRANLVPDQAATERLRVAAMEQVDPVLTSLTKGETIVRDGQIITALHLEQLAAAKILDPQVSWPELFGGGLFALVLSGVLGYYLYVVQPASLVSSRRLLLLGVVLVGAVLAAKLALPGKPLWAIAFPVAAAPMLLTTLLELSLGLTGTIFISLLVTYVADYSPELLAYAPSNPLDSLEKLVLYLTTGLAAALAVWKARRISQYFIAGVGVSLLGTLVVLAFWLLTPDRQGGLLGWQLAAAGGSGLLAAALAVGFFVILGLLFDVTTNIQLNELAHADHPLLRRLLQEAPGTYYHSILVGNLAEQACEAIGADSLLARVGAYYHDIGKVQNPGFFIENQRYGENIHDRLDPLSSASMVLAHVRDGLRLAQEHRLPPHIHAFIREHHGTRLATAFYNKATHLNARVNPELFQYPGPAPRSRETGIVMLADSVEATARSEGLRTPEELDALVDRIVAERIEEGQLRECELTLRDMERIKAVFKSSLRGIFHPRVQYPSPAVPASVPPAEQGASPLLRVVTEEEAERGRDLRSQG